MPRTAVAMLMALIFVAAAYGYESSGGECPAYTPRNCYGECAHLPSYPTYEKEECILDCIDEDQAAQEAHWNCRNSRKTQPSPEPTAPKEPLANLTSTADMAMDRNGEIISDAAGPLNEAAGELRNKTGRKLRITSSGRTLAEQAGEFFDKCLQRKNSDGTYNCTVPVCDKFIGSSLISGYSQAYTLKGALNATVANGNKDQVVDFLVKNGDAAGCPHTKKVAVDAWCDDGGSNYRHDPFCQAELTRIMSERGFCRIGAEGWHFEWDANKSSKTGCNRGGNANYTRWGKTYNPLEKNCASWDYKNHLCVAYGPGAGVRPKAADAAGAEGAVYVRRQGGAAVAAPGGATLTEGDSMLTRNGRARIALGGGGNAELAPHTELRAAGKNAAGQRIFEVKAGRVKVAVQGGEPVRMLTGNAAVSVKGTEFIVAYDPGGGVTGVYAHEGVVGLGAALPEGQAEEWDPDDAPGIVAGQRCMVQGGLLFGASELSQDDWEALSEEFAFQGTGPGDDDGGYEPGRRCLPGFLLLALAAISLQARRTEWI